MKTHTALISLLFGLAATGPVGAQSIETDVVPLDAWGYDEIYAEGMSAEAFIDEMDVYSSTGEVIGDVEDIIAADDGELVAVIAEVGGLWDIGDTHVSVPWRDVEMSAGGITVPVTEETIGDYGLFDREYLSSLSAETGMVGRVDAAETGPRAFRVSELIGDYARLAGDADAIVDYGYVHDVMIQNGAISAVVVNPDVGYGGPGYYTAYPFYGRDYAPGARYYDMPYGADEVGEMPQFEYDRVEMI